MNCRGCKHYNTLDDWCEAKNRKITTTICNKFELGLWAKMINGVRWFFRGR